MVALPRLRGSAAVSCSSRPSQRQARTERSGWHDAVRHWIADETLSAPAATRWSPHHEAEMKLRITGVAPLAALGVLLLGGSALAQAICASDAKACPDGSAVRRTGPDCAFAACPRGTSGSSSGNAGSGAAPAPNCTVPPRPTTQCARGVWNFIPSGNGCGGTWRCATGL
jgi:hypothetical protein